MSSSATSTRHGAPACPGGPSAHEQSGDRPAAPDFVDSLLELYRQASDSSEVWAFIDAQTRMLAWLVLQADRPEATAEILGRFCAHLREFAERRRAEEELRRARERGERLS